MFDTFAAAAVAVDDDATRTVLAIRPSMKPVNHHRLIFLLADMKRKRENWHFNKGKSYLNTIRICH